jgi:phosphoglycolate phosphatase
MQDKMTEISRLSICLDLDGTLIDTAPDLIRVLNEVIAEEGAGETDYLAARKAIGFGSRRLIEDAFKRANKEIAKDRITELQKLFLDIYADSSAQLSRPFDGVTETLAKLKRAGADLSVCTNKPGYLARPLIEALGLTPLFSRIVGSDDLPRNKPHADHIFASAGHRQPSRIVMVGDGAPDALAARAAGVPCVLMAYGYSTVPFEQLGADVILRRFRDLPSALNEL